MISVHRYRGVAVNWTKSTIRIGGVCLCTHYLLISFSSNSISITYNSSRWRDDAQINNKFFCFSSDWFRHISLFCSIFACSLRFFVSCVCMCGIDTPDRQSSFAYFVFVYSFIHIFVLHFVSLSLFFDNFYRLLFRRLIELTHIANTQHTYNLRVSFSCWTGWRPTVWTNTDSSMDGWLDRCVVSILNYTDWMSNNTITSTTTLITWTGQQQQKKKKK